MMKICEEIKNAIMEDKDLISKANNIDIAKNGTFFDIEKCIKSLEWTENSLSDCVAPTDKTNGNTFIQKYVPYDCVGIAVQDNDLLMIVYAVAKALTSDVSACVYLSADKNVTASAFVLGIMGRVATQFGLNVSIETDKERFENSLDRFDNVLIIGSGAFYNSFKGITFKEYIPYGVTDVICLDKSLYNELPSQMKDVVLYTNFKCKKAKSRVNDVEEALKMIMLSGNRYKTILLSHNNGDIEYFKAYAKSDYVLVNVYNEENEVSNISQHSFMKLVNYLI